MILLISFQMFVMVFFIMYDFTLAHFNDNLDEGIDEYKRRIDRFKNIINLSTKLYFVYINEDYLYDNKYREEEFNDINFNEIYTFGFDDWFLDMDSVEELYVKFEKICTDEKKNKMDFTINEIITFIKKSDIYIKIEQDLGFKLKRAIMLSKYTNSITSDKLINALTLEELNILSN